MLRSKRSRFRAAASAAILSLSLAAPAFAGHDDWRGDRHRRGYPVHRHDDRCDRRGHDGYGHEGHHRFRAHRGHRRGDHFACRPCGKRWRRAEGFHRHLNRHHGVAYHAIPRVLVSADWGWEYRR